MTDDNRYSGRGRYQDRDQGYEGERDQRWRRGEERYRREAWGSGGWDDDDRGQDRPDPGDLGYGLKYRDEGQGGRGYAQGDSGYGGRAYYGPHYEQGDSRAGRGYSPRSDYQDRHWQRTGQRDWEHIGGAHDRHLDRGQQDRGYYAQERYGAPDHRDDRRDDRRGFLDRAGDEIASWFGDEDAARRRQADHRGRGPRDYIRSDERIREDANDRLTEDWRVDASGVTVAVKDGEVTLNGTVTHRNAKRRAEDLVENISGVRHVQNNLRVNETARTAGDWAGYGSGVSAGGFGIGYETSRTPEQRATAEGGTVGSAANARSSQTAGQMTQGETATGQTASNTPKTPGSV
ncbi:MAG TPA: BON domain-containing protein [Novosphingobium sp.]|nr:BON domain-containing protein [Novosphingobium sp.]